MDYPKNCHKLHPSDENCPFVICADEFHDVLGASPEFTRLVETDAHEGPVYWKDKNAILFTTVPKSTNIPILTKRVAIKKLSLDNNQVSVWRESSNMANGMTIDREGRLRVCEQGTKSTPARISSFNLDTQDNETVVDQWWGLPFNSPNDIVVKSDNTIWFTDPSYGYLQGFKNPPEVGNFV
ncbi:MAG: SMP-30/gluconolactonase/LRE family protein, partial [Moorea sp. SIO3G5]|nr:SMP-30/gluconolactonase/LRE family protein [Moorena sp. SIO3G5]